MQESKWVTRHWPHDWFFDSVNAYVCPLLSTTHSGTPTHISHQHLTFDYHMQSLSSNDTTNLLYFIGLYASIHRKESTTKEEKLCVYYCNSRRPSTQSSVRLFIMTLVSCHLFLFLWSRISLKPSPASYISLSIFYIPLVCTELLVP
jgi:hypothetical protein